MWLWRFDSEQLWYTAGRVINTSAKFEDPLPTYSWVVSHKVFYWHCVFNHWACAVSRDLCVRGKFYPHVLNPQPWFIYSLCNFVASSMKVIQVICHNNALPCVRSRMVSAHAWNYVVCWRFPKCLIAVVLVDVDLPYSTSKVQHLIAFTTIIINILLCMHRNSHWWHSDVNLHTTVRFPNQDFVIECKILAIWRGFLLIFAGLQLIALYQRLKVIEINIVFKKVKNCYNQGLVSAKLLYVFTPATLHAQC